MTQQHLPDATPYVKLAAASIAGAGVSMADVDIMISILAGVLASIASIIAIYKFLKKRDKK